MSKTKSLLQDSSNPWHRALEKSEDEARAEANWEAESLRLTAVRQASPFKVTIAEAAVFLECSEDRVLELLANGELPGLRKGKPWVIPRDAFYTAVNEIAERNLSTPPKPVPKKSRGRPRVSF